MWVDIGKESRLTVFMVHNHFHSGHAAKLSSASCIFDLQTNAINLIFTGVVSRVVCASLSSKDSRYHGCFKFQHAAFSQVRLTLIAIKREKAIWFQFILLYHSEEFYVDSVFAIKHALPSNFNLTASIWLMLRQDMTISQNWANFHFSKAALAKVTQI